MQRIRKNRKCKRRTSQGKITMKNLNKTNHEQTKEERRTAMKGQGFLSTATNNTEEAEADGFGSSIIRDRFDFGKSKRIQKHRLSNSIGTKERSNSNNSNNSNCRSSIQQLGPVGSLP